MAESINKFKTQQNTYLREVQQEKAARKRDLAAQQQQDLTDLRQHYKEENKKIDEQSADAISHIRSETKEMVQQYMDERRQVQEQARMEQQQERDARIEASHSDSANTASIYDRNGKKKVTIQNHESDKNSDDFYKVQNRGSRVIEKKHNYVIEAYAPEHEKDNIQVSVQRNKAVVSGKRKFGDSIEDGEKKISTNNFQTFREEFKFNGPVSANGMTRERNGDFVRFTIPKMNSIDKEES